MGVIRYAKIRILPQPAHGVLFVAAFPDLEVEDATEFGIFAGAADENISAKAVEDLKQPTQKMLHNTTFYEDTILL